MRVTAGIARGVPLISPIGEGTRPTLDKVKQAIFSMLTSRLGADGFHGTTVLDLFAGSGNLGIEALSRGAVSATFADRDLSSVSAIKQNLAKTKFLERATVIHGDFSQITGRFKLIFLDPPFESGLLCNALEHIRGQNMLEPGGFVVCEHPIQESLNGWNVLTTKTYGKVAVTICKAIE